MADVIPFGPTQQLPTRPPGPAIVVDYVGMAPCCLALCLDSNPMNGDVLRCPTCLAYCYWQGGAWRASSPNARWTT